MPHTIDISTTDGYFDPDNLDILNDSRPEAEAMREACASGDLTAVQYIFKTHWLNQPVDGRVDLKELGASGLCEAIRRDDANIASYLLSNLISMQPVHFAMAIEYHAYAILQLYIDRKWDINTYLSRMQPPALSLAIKDTKLTLWFLSHGADPNATCGLDITPLSIAVRDAPFEVIRILFDHGGSIEHGQLLHFAVIRRLPDRIDVIDYLLNKGTPINSLMYENSADSYEQETYSGLGTPLHSAVTTGCLDTVNILLSRGADPLIKNSCGKLALEEAEYHGCSKVADRLRLLS
ncbi:MAG: hypothetical protein Q9196_002299 [Gyalolechia fulgens]